MLKVIHRLIKTRLSVNMCYSTVAELDPLERVFRNVTYAGKKRKSLWACSFEMLSSDFSSQQCLRTSPTLRKWVIPLTSVRYNNVLKVKHVLKHVLLQD